MTASRPGVILAQLGTPDAPTPAALRRYLAQFLSDQRVVDAPRWWWLPLLHGVILRTRPRRSAALYRKIWRADGVSPLLHTTRAQAEGVARRLGDGVVVTVGMRYGNPSIATALAQLRAQGVDRVLLFPLFPQYAASTTASLMDALCQALAPLRHQPAVRVARPFHDDPPLTAALAGQLRAALPPGHTLLLSFHGLPQRYADLGDPYPQQCAATAHLLAEAMGLQPDQWLLGYQSRFGREPWLQPYTDATLAALPARGVKRVAVACPGFVADCLETLEEIAIQNRATFLAAGGESFHYLPCANQHPPWLDALAQRVKRELAGW